jgi:hypothetical protein
MFRGGTRVPIVSVGKGQDLVGHLFKTDPLNCDARHVVLEDLIFLINQHNYTDNYNNYKSNANECRDLRHFS